MSKKIEAICTGACLQNACIVSAGAQIPINFTVGFFRYDLACTKLVGKHCTAGARMNYTAEGTPLLDPRCAILTALDNNEENVTPFLVRKP